MPDALAGGCEDGIEHRRCRDGDGGLAHAPPEAARGVDDGLHLGHRVHLHHRVAVEIRLLDAAILDRAFAIKRGGEAIDKAALNLGGDLLRVDREAAIRRCHDAMDFQFARIAHRDLGAGRHIAAKAVRHAKPAMHRLAANGRGRAAPAHLGRHRIEHRPVLRVIRHQRPAILQRVFPGGMRQLIHEAFQIEGVLVEVHTAPETRRHMRVAHGMVDQQIREAIADIGLAPGIVQPLEDHRVTPVTDILREEAGQDGLAGNPHMQPGDIALRIQPRRQLGHGDGVVAALHHILLTRPEQLHRRAGHLLGDIDDLTDPVMHRTTPAKAAAQMQLMHLAARRRQAGGLGCGGMRGLAILGRGPNFAALGRPNCGGVHHLHAGMVLVRIAINGLNLARRGGDGGGSVAIAVAHRRLRRIQPRAHHLGKGGRGGIGMLAQIPGDIDLLERGLGPPPGIGHHGHGIVAHAQHTLHPGHALGRSTIHRGHGAAKDRAGLDGGIEHARQLEVHAIDQAAIDFRRGVEPGEGVADQLPGRGGLQRHIGGGGRREAARGQRHAAETRAASARAMGDDAIRRRAFAHRHAPALRRSLHQHDARCGAALADQLIALTNATAAAGGHIAPDPAAGEVLAGGGVFGGHFGPVAFQFLSHHLRQAGEGALAHLGACDADDDGVIRLDDDPGIDLGRGGALGGRLARGGDAEAKGEGAHGGSGQGRAASDGVHGLSPSQPAVPVPAAR